MGPFSSINLSLTLPLFGIRYLKCIEIGLVCFLPTRWAENHDGLLRFKEIFEAIASALEDLSSDSDCDISSKASSFFAINLHDLFCSKFVLFELYIWIYITTLQDAAIHYLRFFGCFRSC